MREIDISYKEKTNTLRLDDHFLIAAAILKWESRPPVDLLLAELRRNLSGNIFEQQKFDPIF